MNIKDEKPNNEGSNTNSNNTSRSPSPSKLKTSADRNTNSPSGGNAKSNTNETKSGTEENKANIGDGKSSHGAGTQAKQDPARVLDLVPKPSTNVKTENTQGITTNIFGGKDGALEEKKEEKESGSALLVPSSPLKFESIGDGTDSDDTIMLVSDSIPVNKEETSKGDEGKAGQAPEH